MPTFFGNNRLGAQEIFNQRLAYFYKGYYSTNIDPIDLWTRKPLYGKLDLNGATIYPIENTLKRLESAPNENIFALNFVADAFKDFRQHYIATQQRDASGSMFERLIPRKAYENPLIDWQNYLNDIWVLFKREWLTTDGRNQKVISFKDYLREFELFIKEFGPKMPITLTNYLLSTEVSPLISGIIIELSEADHGDDLSKSLFYMKNICFSCYIEAARKYGFKIDKNAPWRLVADLKSPALTPYLERNGLSFPTLFKRCYNKTYNTEINLLKNFLLDSYTTFVAQSPQVSIYEYYGKCKRTLQRIISREVLVEARTNEQFPDSFWMGYYIQILANESPNVMSPKDIFNLTAMAQTLVKNGSPVMAQQIVFDSFKKMG